MTDNIVEITYYKDLTDGELLGQACNDLNNAMDSLGQMKHPIGDTLFHMVHAVAFYLEQYLMKEASDIYKLPKLEWPKWMKDINDSLEKKDDKYAS
jgi:hypothetical protein